jgi:hypothetical protein
LYDHYLTGDVIYDAEIRKFVRFSRCDWAGFSRPYGKRTPGPACRDTINGP